jgi:thiol-disulfide isomerase/thioredoxin
VDAFFAQAQAQAQAQVQTKRGRARVVVALMVASSAAPGVGALPSVEAVETVWSAKLPEFRADTPVEAAPTVLYFTATWCGYCHQMDRTTLSNDKVHLQLAPFGRIKLDYDQQPELVARYQIRGVPAFVMVNARGEEVSRLVGAAEVGPFCSWLEEGKIRAAGMVKEAARRQAELQALAEMLTIGGTEGWAKTKAQIFELAARGGPEAREYALKQLTMRAGLRPSALFEGLLHPDLAVRLAVTGILKKALGERFVFDPWADAATRETVVRDEQFAMFADMSVSVVVEARFVEIKAPIPAGGALGFLATAVQQPPGAVVGVLSSEETAAVLAGVKALKGTSVMNAPKVTVGSGNPTRMVIGQEMRHPIRWQKNPEGPGWLPADYETRTVGVEMSVTPQVQVDGAIELDVKPKITEFEGFVEFAEAAGADDNGPAFVTLNGKPMQVKPPFTPLFSERAVTAGVRVPPGRTVVLQGGPKKQISWPLAGGGRPSETTSDASSVTLIFVTAAVQAPAKNGR